VRLLGSFGFRVDGVEVQLPPAVERLIAFLALQRHPVTRQRVAGVLWPDVAEERSLGSLRSALWRLRRWGRGLVVADDVRLHLSTTTELDTEVLTDQSHRLAHPGDVDLSVIDVSTFGRELLPGWYDDWVVFERERVRQLSLHGLEALSRRHATAGRHADAIEAAWRAIALDPLRESAHGTLVDAHLAEGNLSEAVRCLKVYADMLQAELGVAPGDELLLRVDDALARRCRAARSVSRA
jgi:DNA-binding SARP family transcriptional activator